MAPTIIEMQSMQSQIEMAKALFAIMPGILKALERIADALETIAADHRDGLDMVSTSIDNLKEQKTTLDEHFMSVIEMQTGITENGVGHEGDDDAA